MHFADKIAIETCVYIDIDGEVIYSKWKSSEYKWYKPQLIIISPSYGKTCVIRSSEHERIVA